MAAALSPSRRRTVGVRDIPLALLAPRRLFARVEDVPAWGWPLVVLLASVTLSGWATVQTGLIDREAALNVLERLAKIDSTQRDVVERSELREAYEQEYKRGVFALLMARLWVLTVAPVQVLATVLLVGSVLYGFAALSGRKPEWHTLLTVCVFAAFVEALRLWVVLGLSVYFRTLDVDTSPALFVTSWAAKRGMDGTMAAVWSGLSTAADPFRLWFWWVVIVGVVATAQLGRWKAWIVCGLCWLVATGVRVGWAYVAVQTVDRLGGA